MRTENQKQNIDQITNRHIAKLLDRLSVFNLHEIVESEIKRQMHFLKEDIKTSVKQEESGNNYAKEINYNR